MVRLQPAASARAALVWTVVLALAPLAQADHGAPAPQLGGVALCTDESSVQAEVLGAEEQPRRELMRALERRALERLRRALTLAEVPHRQAEVCEGEGGYVALELYTRYLDPEVYLGFPENAYTTVLTTQVGRHTPTLASDAALLEGVYVASTSDILQAPDDGALQTQLLSLTDDQAQLLGQTWLEANVVPPQRLALFGALALALVLLRGAASWTAVRR